MAAWIGVAVLFLSLIISTQLDNWSDDVIVQGVCQAIVVVGWVAIWNPAARFIVEVAPHVFNPRYAEFADIDVRFVWVLGRGVCRRLSDRRSRPRPRPAWAGARTP